MAQRTIAEEQKKVADERRQEAEHNFAAAKEGANSLVLEIAQALRGEEGMRTETVRKILGIAEQVIGKLVEKSEDNPELLDLQATMLHEFAQTYAFQGDTTKANEAAQNLRSPLPTAWPRPTPATPAGNTPSQLRMTNSATCFRRKAILRER